jgi:(S)-citramalyl-CoA lyase
VRINTPNSRNGLNDLAALLDAEFQPAFIVIPKVEAAQTVLQVEALLREVASDARVVPLGESRQGVVVLPEVLATASRVAALMFGAGDYAGDVGVQPCSSCRGTRRAACACVGSRIPLPDWLPSRVSAASSSFAFPVAYELYNA